MTSLGQKSFVVLLDAEQLSALFRDWPAGMNLAVCLRQEGECRMQVYRQEEGMRVLPRLLRAMRLTKSDISVFPEVEGYPARSMYFSEEKQLFEIVQNAPEIVEEASDYSVNYTYAMDEGLDPVLFLHASKARGRQKQKALLEERRWSQTEHFPTRKRVNSEGAKQHSVIQTSPSSNPDLPKFLQNPPVSKAKPPVTQIEQKRKASPGARFCLVQDSGNGWISVELPGGIGQEVMVTKPEQIFLRGDRRALSFGKMVLGDVSQALPKRIHVNMGEKNTLLGDALRKNLGVVHAHVQDGLLFLELSHVTEDESALQPLVKEPSRKPHWKSWTSAGAIATFSALMVLSFFPLHKSQNESSIDWNQFRVDSREDGVTSFQSQLGLLDLTSEAES